MSEIRGVLTEDVSHYGPRMKGTPGNYKNEVSVDVTGGYVGITQFDGDSKTVTDRVLLSPNQWADIVKFVKRRQP